MIETPLPPNRKPKFGHSQIIRLGRLLNMQYTLKCQIVHPYPCGYFQDAVKECTCSNSEVPHVDHEKLSDDRLGEPSANVQARMEAARKRQRARFAVGARHASPQQQIACCQLDETSNSLMRVAMNQMPAVLQRRFQRGPITGCLRQLR